MTAPGESGSVAIRHVAWLFVGVFGMAACLTVVFFGMRAVMDIGGACADGGPFVSRQPCPEGVGLLMGLAFPLGFLFGAIIMWAGGRIGGGYAGLALLAWPVLFISLGWNFLEYGVFDPPPEVDGIEWGWAIPGVLFVAMGVAPVLFVVWTVREARAFEPRRYGLPDLRQDDREPTFERWWTRVPEAARPQPSSSAAPTGPTPASGREGRPGPGDDAIDDALVDQLERLARLHASGALSEEEFAAAKRRVLLGEETAG